MKIFQFIVSIMIIASLGISCNRTKEPVASNPVCNPDSTYWKISHAGEITWDVNSGKHLPHGDNIEMSGRKLSGIISYEIDSLKRLILSRKIIYPTFRLVFKKGFPEVFKYRSYLKKTYSDSLLPVISVNGKIENRIANEVKINGTLQFTETIGGKVKLERTLYPSTDKFLFIESWKITNMSGDSCTIALNSVDKLDKEEGIYGEYNIHLNAKSLKQTLKKGESLTTPVYFSANIKGQPIVTTDAENELQNRKTFLCTITENLILDTPDSILNNAFAFAKIRTSESLYDTKLGLMHSPGGERYYAGVWANDQVEYSGPFFPFLGYSPANEASLNAYRIFAKDMKSDFTRIWSSHEMEGDLPCCSRDRGDAAMYAFGASRFALASGENAIAEELWPAIEWSLEYCKRRTNAEGVVESETDEMEGRIATGTANLSTSTLTYGALISASHLATDLGKKELAATYSQRADSLKVAIERYFGADIDGYHTYKYFKEHNKLRHWICLPLTMEIFDRKEGTLKALFEKLWSINGLNVETGEKMFWDRGTLYALRGIFMAGETETAYDKLKEFTCRRFLGTHVPYAVEAWPEGDQAQLAAESALYCRIFTEGLFGILPVGLRSFQCTPQMPLSWNHMQIKNIKAFGNSFDMAVDRINSRKLKITLTTAGKEIYTSELKTGESTLITLK